MRGKSKIFLFFWAIWQIATTFLRAGKGTQKALLKAEYKPAYAISPSDLDHIKQRSAAINNLAKLWPTKIQCTQRSYAMWLWLENQGYNPTMEVGWQDKKAHAWIRIGNNVVNDEQDIGDRWISLRKESNHLTALNRENELIMRQTYWKVANEAVAKQLDNSHFANYVFPSINDWDQFLKSIDYWNVGSTLDCLALEHSQHILPDLVNRLQKRLSLRKAKYTAALSELIDICGRFKSAGINYIYIKGFSLPAHANTDPLLRDMVDFDFLIPPEQLKLTHEILTDAGYIAKDPVIEIGFDRLSRTSHHEVTYTSPKAILPIEIHWRLSEIKMLEIKNMDYFLAQTVELSICGNSVVSLNKIASTILASLHGARHYWFRIKWIADFASLILTMPPQEQEEFVKTCQKIGCTRVIAASIKLVNDLLKINLPKFATDMLKYVDPKRDELASVWMKMCVPSIDSGARNPANLRTANHLVKPSLISRIRWRIFELTSPDVELIEMFPQVNSRLSVFFAKIKRKISH